MPDLRWALHDFSPENEDELAFQAGDEIQVVEKDDLYGDGWWQVMHLSTSRDTQKLTRNAMSRGE